MSNTNCILYDVVYENVQIIYQILSHHLLDFILIKLKCNTLIFKRTNILKNFSLGGLTLVLNVNSHAYLSPSRPQIGLIVSEFEF